MIKRNSRLMFLILAFFGLVGSVVATQGVANASAPPVQICSNLGGCMNRQGGGTASGTNVIDYTLNDPNNDFSFFFLSTWCGGTGRVRNGEGGVLCPFYNGSGLNARYDGLPLYSLDAYAQNKEVTIPNFTNTYAKLGNYGDQGYAFVRSSQGFLISIGVSNERYAAGNGSNNPYWLNEQAVSGPLVVYNRADDEWGCVGHGTDNC